MSEISKSIQLGLLHLVSWGLIFFNLGACGGGIGIEDFDSEDNVDSVSDYGKNTPSAATSPVDEELEAFWAQVDEVIAQLPSKKSIRLIQNLRELRIRFDRSTADVILQISRRLISGGDLEMFTESASLELALLLEQKVGEALMAQLIEFRAVSPENIAQFLSGLDTQKPENSEIKQLEEAEEILSKITISPEIKPKPGTYSTPKEIVMSSATPGAQIFYTLDNSDPSRDSTLYTGPFVIGETEEFVVIKAIALAEGLEESAVFLAPYSILLPIAASVSFSALPGGYNQPINISLSTTEQNAEIRFTKDGSMPVASSALYTAPFAVGAAESLSLKARTFAKLKRPGIVAVGDFFVDSEAPQLPLDATLNFFSVSSSEFSLRWNFATDNHDAPAELMYRVVVALAGEDIDSSSEVISVSNSCDSMVFPCRSGVLPGKAGITYSLRGLQSSSQYFVNLYVVDGAGNSTLFGVQGLTTLDP